MNISDFKVICNEQEQYSRRECLEIQGIPLPSKDSQHIEDTNKIVIQVGELMGVQIQAEDISISHRLPLSSKYKGKRRLSAIIVKFVRRSTKEAYYRKRKDLHAFTTKDLGFKEENHIYVNCYVMFPSMKCTQTFVNGPLMSVLSKDGGLTFVHVTQRTVIPISLHPLFSH